MNRLALINLSSSSGGGGGGGGGGISISSSSSSSSNSDDDDDDDDDDNNNNNSMYKARFYANVSCSSSHCTKTSAKRMSFKATLTRKPTHKQAHKYRKSRAVLYIFVIVQELCESRGGRPGLSVLTSLLFSVDVKLY